MKYMGSKDAIGKDLFEFILTDCKIYTGNWVEPFVGGGNMIKYIPEPDWIGGFNRYANDYNQCVVACLSAIADGWIPPTDISEDLYNDIKSDHKAGLTVYDDKLKGFAGIGSSFGSMFMGGYARGKDKNGTSRNYARETKDNLIKQAKFLQNITWTTGSYSNMGLPSPDNTIIYCDPPYNNTAGYGVEFDHDAFYQWVRDKARQGYKIYISEYSMPDDFELIHSIDVKCHLNNTSAETHTKRVENLYTIKGV